MSTAGADGEPPNGSEPDPVNGTAGGWFTRWRKDPGAVAPGFAAAILGFAVGHLTGLSGPDATVLAAVLPAILSAGGAVAAFLATRGYEGKHHTRVVSGLIVLFSVALLVGAHFGSWLRSTIQTQAFHEAADAWQARHIKELKNCTILELRTNDRRAALDLPPLTISQVCPFLDDPHLAPEQMPE